MTPKPTHTCYAIGCEKIVPQWQLMCHKHWAKVPRDIQDEIYKQRRAGDKIQWLEAIHEARDRVLMMKELAT